MTQYCRYCCHLKTEDGPWCSRRNEKMSEAVAKSPNRCHDYAYSIIDAFPSTECSPRKTKKRQCDGQMSLF